ncbi:MAG: toll/interleukin-1 receptor domain-containing protein [Alicyclobacillus sp.]|nr:toll/interleukin-1 receptor domain-containing protein [Alicyclobacillus sp.]
MDKHYNIFLSHSYLDSDGVLALKSEIEEMGYSVYVDWIEDKQLSRERVTKETAAMLRQRMDCCDCLLFVVTENSPQSKWMPWELGYFDGAKHGKVAILPVVSTLQDRYIGQEYLGLYFYIDKCPAKGRTTMRLWVNESEDVYVDFDSWLKGKRPYKHS